MKEKSPLAERLKLWFVCLAFMGLAGAVGFRVGSERSKQPGRSEATTAAIPGSSVRNDGDAETVAPGGGRDGRRNSLGEIRSLRERNAALEREAAKLRREVDELGQRLQTVARENASYAELLAIEGITTEDLTEAAADGGIIFKPGSIESTGVPVSDSTSLDVGQCLQVKWGEKWWAAEVISLEDDGWVGIHYVGWTETHDEIVPRSDLQLDPEAAAKVSGTDAARALIFQGIADRAIKRKISEAFDLNAQR